MYCPGPFYGQDQKKNATEPLAIAYLLFEAEHTAERPAQISTKVGLAPLVRTGGILPRCFTPFNFELNIWNRFIEEGSQSDF